LHVSEDATSAPRQRKRKSGTDPVAADLSLDLGQTDISSEPDLPMKEEEKPTNESDGLEEYWKDFALAIESTKVCMSTTKFVYSAALFKKFLLMNTCCIIYLNIERCFLRSIFLVVYYVLLIARNIPPFHNVRLSQQYEHCRKAKDPDIIC